MKFGYLEDPSNVDYNLPEVELANQIQRDQPVTLHIGGSKWGIREWVGNVYPKGTKPTDYLYHYSRYFNSIELNASGYGLRMLDSLEKWTQQVPAGFTFSPKFPRTVSHYRKLTGPGLSSAHDFLRRVSDFGSHLGCPFLQMNASFDPTHMDALIDFVEETSSLGHYAIELRHPAWFIDVHSEVKSLLREHGISWVITDTPGRRDVVHCTRTSDILFVRFAASLNMEIDQSRLTAWADRVATMSSQGIKHLYLNVHAMNPQLVPILVDFFKQAISNRFDREQNTIRISGN